MTTITLKNSPDASARLLQIVDDEGSLADFDDALGETDCPNGCVVEPDGYCPHGWKSAGLSAGLI